MLMCAHLPVSWAAFRLTLTHVSLTHVTLGTNIYDWGPQRKTTFCWKGRLIDRHKAMHKRPLCINTGGLKYTNPASLTCFHENGHISANNGPIFKIQNLASSGEQPASAAFDNGVARETAREIAWRARVTSSTQIWLEMTLSWTCPFTRRDPHAVANQRHAI